VTFGAVAERWIANESHQGAENCCRVSRSVGYRCATPWGDVALREVRYDDMQVWITGLSADGSVRFEGNGLSASRVRQAHQLIGAVPRFAVRCRYIATNPVDDIDLPKLPEAEQAT
jgi:hypothetical protein